MPFLIALTIHLHFPDNGSLKGKRKELLSVRSALQPQVRGVGRGGRRPGPVAARHARRRARLAHGRRPRARGRRDRALSVRPLSRERARGAEARVVSGPGRTRLCNRRSLVRRMGVRDEKKRETRARLERAALDLFAGRGYDGTTVEDVAAMAGVSARTAFRYFPAKADLVFGDASRTSRPCGPAGGAGPVASRLRGGPHRAGGVLRADRYADQRRAGARDRSEPDPRGPQPRRSAQLWAEAIAAELAARRGPPAPDERDRLGGLPRRRDPAVRGARMVSRGRPRPHSLREAVDRTASWAAEMLQP